MALGALAMTGVAQARIGETLEQCTARYGQLHKGSKEGQFFFMKEEMMVAITLHEGKCVGILFSSANNSLAAAQVLLEANRGNTTWKAPVKMDGVEEGLSWASTDGKREASFFGPGQPFTITDTAGLAAWEAAKDKGNAAKLKGF